MAHLDVELYGLMLPGVHSKEMFMLTTSSHALACACARPCRDFDESRMQSEEAYV